MELANVTMETAKGEALKLLEAVCLELESLEFWSALTKCEAARKIIETWMIDYE